MARVHVFDVGGKMFHDPVALEFQRGRDHLVLDRPRFEGAGEAVYLGVARERRQPGGQLAAEGLFDRLEKVADGEPGKEVTWIDLTGPEAEVD